MPTHYDSVVPHVLTEVVPEDVRISFDTARNLYLYAWFVYRIYNVIDQDREDYDYLQVLLKDIPDTRNHYTLGSGMLHNRVLHSYEVVSGLVNQLFADVDE